MRRDGDRRRLVLHQVAANASRLLRPDEDAVPGAHDQRPPARRVEHGHRALVHLRERAVAAVGVVPERAAHGRRTEAAGRPEAALARAPERAHDLLRAGLRRRDHGLHLALCLRLPVLRRLRDLLHRADGEVAAAHHERRDAVRGERELELAAVEVRRLRQAVRGDGRDRDDAVRRVDHRAERDLLPARQ